MNCEPVLSSYSHYFVFVDSIGSIFVVYEGSNQTAQIHRQVQPLLFTHGLTNLFSLSPLVHIKYTCKLKVPIGHVTKLRYSFFILTILNTYVPLIFNAKIQLKIP